MNEIIQTNIVKCYYMTVEQILSRLSRCNKRMIENNKADSSTQSLYGQVEGSCERSVLFGEPAMCDLVRT